MSENEKNKGWGGPQEQALRLLSERHYSQYCFSEKVVIPTREKKHCYSDQHI